MTAARNGAGSVMVNELDQEELSFLTAHGFVVEEKTSGIIPETTEYWTIRWGYDD